MKKILGIMVMSLVAFLPISAKAATGIVPNCSNADANGVVNCTIVYDITDEAGKENLTVTLTEKGGADIIDVVDANDTDWSVSSKNELNGVWTVMLVSPGVSGEGNLFSFSYKTSGTQDCSIAVALGNETATITPTTIPDEAADNKQTGTTLPYIALGTVALVAVGAYLATRNKAKMYRI